MDDLIAEPASNAHEFTVSELSQSVKRTVEDEFGFVRVRGEVGRLSRPASGHLYFDLKDEKASLSAVAWKGVATKWQFQPEQGLEVVVTGRLTTFPGQSKYQIIVENVAPAGVGALMVLLEKRRKKLAAEGLFDADRKQKLPFLPRCIGVVTSPTGAVIRDILHRLEDRFPTNVLVWPVRVQGASSAPEVAAAVAGFNNLPVNGAIERPDLIIIARGGGSVEDLWGFNEESVVRAIAESSIPVIAAIGHETDTTLADFVADLRAPTPTGAAEIAVSVRSELVSAIDNLGTRGRQGVRRLLATARDRVRASAAGLPRPAGMVSDARQRLDLAQSRLFAALSGVRQKKALQLARFAPRLGKRLLQQGLVRHHTQVAALSARLKPAVSRKLTDKRQRLGQIWKLANSLSYRNILDRGFVLVTNNKGKVFRTAASLGPGELVNMRFVDGQHSAIVQNQEIMPKNVPKAKKTQPLPDDGQADLF